MKTFTKELLQSQKDWKIMNNPYLDDRPLTDEALEELGFEFVEDELMWNLDMIDKPFFSIVPDTKNGGYLFIHDDLVRLRTVCKLKMLIEALKGDE